MNFTANRTASPGSIFSSVVAALCILIYIAAIAFGAVRVFMNMSERQNLAKAEFDIIADRAVTASVFLGFMTEAYQESITDFLRSSRTPILGIIITGPMGDYAFERSPGSGIVWSGNVPRLRSGAGFPGEPFYLPLRIDGQRSVNIYAIYSIIDYNFFVSVLRDTLTAVLIALGAAFITLMVELILKRRNQGVSAAQAAKPKAGVSVREDQPVKGQSTNNQSIYKQSVYSESAYSHHELYIHEKLAVVLNSCTSQGKDLSVMVVQINGSINSSDYTEFTEAAIGFFSLNDSVYEKENNGIYVFLPGMDLDTAMEKSEEFRSSLTDLMPDFIFDRSLLHIGISSRGTREINSERLLLEAETALEKIAEDPESPTVGFKNDPDKYREFIKKTYI